MAMPCGGRYCKSKFVAELVDMPKGSSSKGESECESEAFHIASSKYSSCELLGHVGDNTVYELVVDAPSGDSAVGPALVDDMKADVVGEISSEVCCRLHLAVKEELATEKLAVAVLADVSDGVLGLLGSPIVKDLKADVVGESSSESLGAASKQELKQHVQQLEHCFPIPLAVNRVPPVA